MPAHPVRVLPLTVERWPDLEKLFGPRGCAGCWCMWWRLPRAEFDAGNGEGNRRALRRRVRRGDVPGLLAYEDGEPVGWVAVEPREAYPRLARSQPLAPVDDRPVWSITCFFVARRYRGKGLTRALVEGASRHARAHGASLLEAYPVELAARTGDPLLYHGAASTFRALGFAEVARRRPTRPIVRLSLRRARAESRSLNARRAPAARGRAGARSRRGSSPRRASRARPGR